MRKKFIFEDNLQDLETIENKKIDTENNNINFKQNENKIENDEVSDEENKEEKIDYDYKLKISETEDSTEENKKFKFILVQNINKENSENLKNDEDVKNIKQNEEQIKKEFTPPPSVLKTNENKELQEIENPYLYKFLKEEEEQEIENLDKKNNSQSTDKLNDDKIDVDNLNLEAKEFIFNSEDELRNFFNSLKDITVNFYIDEDIEFQLDEVIDYLKLYPDTEIYVKINNFESFKESLNRYFENKKSSSDTQNQNNNNNLDNQQNVVLNSQEEKLKLSSSNQTNPQKVAQESINKENKFVILKIKDDKNLPDGIYIADVKENILFSCFDAELTKNELSLYNNKFVLKEEINLKKAKEDNEIEFKISSEDYFKFTSLLYNKSDIILKIS